jgi:hypothetical protein
LSFLLLLFFCGTGVWTQGLYLSHSITLYQSFFVKVFFFSFFKDRVSWTICPGWLQMVIRLISASWVASITGTSHRALLLLGRHSTTWNTSPASPPTFFGDKNLSM